MREKIFFHNRWRLLVYPNAAVLILLLYQRRMMVLMCFIKQLLEGTKEFFHMGFCLLGAVRRLLMPFFCLFTRQQVCFICNGRNEKGTVVKWHAKTQKPMR